MYTRSHRILTRLALTALATLTAIPLATAQPAPAGSEKQYDACKKLFQDGAPSSMDGMLELAKAPDSDWYGAELEAAIPHFDKVAKACEAECKGVKNPPPGPFKREVDADAELWCTAAAGRLALYKLNTVKGMLSWNKVSGPVDEPKTRAEYVEKEGYLYSFRVEPQGAHLAQKAKRARYAKEGYEKKWKLAAMTDAEIDAAVESTMVHDAVLWKIIDEMAPTYAFPKGNKDGAIETMAKKTIMADIPKAKVLGTMMKDKDYRVRLNMMKQPIERWKDGSIWFQVPGEKWCRQLGFTYTEQYAKKYVKPQRTTLNLFRYVACKK